MIKIIPTTKEKIKKYNILGADVSVGFAKYAFKYEMHNSINQSYSVEPVNFFYQNYEEYSIITTQLILWRFKFEVKTVVEHHFKFA